MRITQSTPALPAVARGAPINVCVDGRTLGAFEGETVAAVLLAHDMRRFRQTPRMGRPRGIFCGIGICHDCLVTVNGLPNVRACVTPVTDGMVIDTCQEAQP